MTTIRRSFCDWLRFIKERHDEFNRPIIYTFKQTNKTNTKYISQ